MESNLFYTRVPYFFNTLILLKSPLWCPMIVLLILGNGGKLIK